MKVLVTGAAGFIGAAVAARLLARGDTVIGLDNLNPYYDPVLKWRRLALLPNPDQFTFEDRDIGDRDEVAEVFRLHRPDAVVHLAAQAGVRHSIASPHIYVEANVMGFLNVLQGVREIGTRHLVYASTSAVYGASRQLPFSASSGADHPLSLYAATKGSNELMAHAYSHLFALPTSGLRFFTVYGPWGRPDMALFLFAKRILAGEPIDVFNYGDHERDFTYIDDAADAVVRVLDRPPTGNASWDGAHPDPSSSPAPFRVLNIGGGNPVQLAHLIALLEENLGRKAERNLLPLQPGDVPATAADIGPLAAEFGFRPATPIAEGVARFVAWYRDYYGAGGAGAGSEGGA